MRLTSVLSRLIFTAQNTVNTSLWLVTLMMCLRMEKIQSWCTNVTMLATTCTRFSFVMDAKWSVRIYGILGSLRVRTISFDVLESKKEVTASSTNRIRRKSTRGYVQELWITWSPQVNGENTSHMPSPLLPTMKPLPRSGFPSLKKKFSLHQRGGLPVEALA